MWRAIHNLASPKFFFKLSNKLIPGLSLLFLFTFGYGLVGGLILAPEDYLQGNAFRIIYVHAPCAFMSLCIYTVMAFAAFMGLIWRYKLAFLLIRHSAPLGATFTFLALFTGSIWGKPMWGTWWIWDARLTSELILLFLYFGILLFQSATAHHKHGDRTTAILILVGFVDIPIIHYSVNWWNTLHQGPTLNLFAHSAINSTMLYPLLSMVCAFFVYYALVVLLRMRNDLLMTHDHWL